MVEYTQEVSAEVGLPVYAFGHAGDGNIHTEVIADRAIDGEFERAGERPPTLSCGALAGGRHRGRRARHWRGQGEFMAAEHGPALELMRQIKAIIDPKNIMNPGKIFAPSMMELLAAGAAELGFSAQRQPSRAV